MSAIVEEARTNVRGCTTWIGRDQTSAVGAKVGRGRAAEAGAWNVGRTAEDEAISFIAWTWIPQRVGREVTIALEQSFTIGVAHRDDCVAAAAIEIATHGDRKRGDRTVEVAEGSFRRSVDFNAFEIVLQEEVDNTGNSVGTVNSGSTTGHDINALDHGGRDVVQIDDLVDARSDEALTVNEDQCAVCAKATKADPCRTITWVV